MPLPAGLLQELLGNRDLSTILRYARVSDALVERESARVARVLARRNRGARERGL